MPGDAQVGKSMLEVIDELGVYPAEAFDFVRQGLIYTVNRIHGESTDPNANRHVSGPDLCLGLREYSFLQWGLLAGMVLRRWNIISTLDFGRIVFAMVDNGFMQRTDDDCLEDFRNVYEFRSAFESGYKIESRT